MKVNRYLNSDSDAHQAKKQSTDRPSEKSISQFRKLYHKERTRDFIKDHFDHLQEEDIPLWSLYSRHMISSDTIQSNDIEMVSLNFINLFDRIEEASGKIISSDITFYINEGVLPQTFVRVGQRYGDILIQIVVDQKNILSMLMQHAPYLLERLLRANANRSYRISLKHREDLTQSYVLKGNAQRQFDGHWVLGD